MGPCPDAIKRLIEHFDLQSDQVRSPDYYDTQLRIDFVNPLFKALGRPVHERYGVTGNDIRIVEEATR